MSKAIAVVEGQTEQIFVRDMLAPWLWDAARVEFVAAAAGNPGKKGGNSYGKVKRDILKHLKNPHFTLVTTFFDFYGMPLKWPGRTEARRKNQANKPLAVEKAIRDDIKGEVGKDVIARLLPYVQMHEFEALLFSDTAALPAVMRHEGSKKQMDAIREEFATPEEINDSTQTAPSKRIEGIFRYYRKPLHGVLTAKRISIEVMMDQCPHFKEWLEKLLAAFAKGKK